MNNEQKGLEKKKRYGEINKKILTEKDLKVPKRSTTDSKQIYVTYYKDANVPF